MSALECQPGNGPDATREEGTDVSLRTPMTKSRGRDCGTNSNAFITSAPTEYPASSIALQIVAKSLPPCEVNAPQTFSSTIKGGTRPSSTRSVTRFQNRQRVPDLSPFKPAPAPARERSWHGNEAHTKFAVPGKSAVRNNSTLADFSSPVSPQF